MDLTHYERFKSHLEHGDRAGAALHIERFVASFGQIEEKSVWVRWYLDHEEIGHRIRHEIYEHLVFPVLLQGYRQADPWAIRWLIRTVQNLYKADHLWIKLDRRTEHGLLTELQALCPSDKEVRLSLLQSHIRQFRYVINEWPAGILYGHDGASQEECTHILLDVENARRLDIESVYSTFLNGVESKVLEYLAQLVRRRARDDA